MHRTLVLDLDGTLVDSVDDLAAALNRLLLPRGLPPTGRTEMMRLVGNGPRMLLDGALAARGATLDEPTMAAFLADYTTFPAVKSRPFPGAEDALATLAAAGWRFAVCTNKPEAAARILLADLGLAGRLAAIGGGDSFPTRKPDPAHLRGTLQAAGGTPDRAVMVGDHANDVLAAAGCAVPCVFAAWGYGPVAMADGAAAIAGSMADLPAICERLVPA